MDKRRLGENDDEEALRALLREFGLDDDEVLAEDDEPAPRGVLKQRAELPPGVAVREAEADDADDIIALLQEMAEPYGERSPATAGYFEEYLSYPGCGALVATLDDEVVGLLSYTVRPNLYHAADACRVEELVVRATARNRGIGGALLDEITELAAALGCRELSLAVVADNDEALRFYAHRGLTEQTLLLERHF